MNGHVSKAAVFPAMVKSSTGPPGWCLASVASVGTAKKGKASLTLNFPDGPKTFSVNMNALPATAHLSGSGVPGAGAPMVYARCATKAQAVAAVADLNALEAAKRTAATPASARRGAAISGASTAAPTPADTPSVLHYTSGSTGKPKGVQHRHGSVVGQQATTVEVLGLRQP